MTVLMAFALLACWTLARDRRHVRYFPMIVMNDGSETAFVLHNPGKRPIEVLVLLRAPDSSELISEEVPVGPLQTKRLIYPGGAGKAVGGWAALSSTEPFIAVEMMKAGPSPWVGVPEIVPSRRFRVFGMVDLADGLQTGMALANPNQKAAKVDLLLRDPEGNEVRRKTLSLPPLSNTSG